jgi:hypothetical protein
MSSNIEKISKQEFALYEPMQKWFGSYLQNKNPHAEVIVHDVHKIYLSDFFTKANLRQDFPDYSTYRIKIDLLGVIKRKKQYELVFIEVKDGALNFSHLAQLLVYSKLVRPVKAVLISPQGMSTHLNDIVNKYHRVDMLEYMPSRTIQLAKWDSHRGAIFL